MTSINIDAVRRCCADHVSWVQILDGQLDVVVLSCVLAKVALNEKSEIDFTASE